MRLVRPYIVLVVASLAGCKKEPPAKQHAPGSASRALADRAWETRFFGWDMAPRLAAFQGAHVVQGESPGAWEAWNVVGDKLTVWDGKLESHKTLQLISPCEVRVLDDDTTDIRSITRVYTVEDGAVVLPMAAAGVRRGAEAVACLGHAVIILDDKGACTTTPPTGYFTGKSEPATCGFRKQGDDEVFAAMVKIGGVAHETVFRVTSEAMIAPSPSTEHFADFAAARAARDAKQ